MKYLKEEPFVSVRGGSYGLTIQQDDGTFEEIEKATVGQTVKMNLDTWLPRPDQILTIGELRTLNRALDILTEDPQEDGYYRFEDPDFALLRKVVAWQSPLIMVRNAPGLDDYLAAAVDTLPKEKESDPKKGSSEEAHSEDPGDGPGEPVEPHSQERS